MAVKRTTPELTEEFDGVAEVIEKVPDQMREGGEQWHIGLKPLDTELLKDTKTGMFHVWLRLGAKGKDDEVSEGSKLDNYLKEIEATIPEAKKATSVKDALGTLKGKKIHYILKVIGRAYGGYESKPVFVPRSLI